MNLQTYPCCPFESFVENVCTYIGENFKDVRTNKSMTSFHGDNLVSIERCISRILKYSPSTTESIIIALLYLERIENYTFRGFVNPVTVNRLFLTGLLIASKYFDDIAFPNTIYCKIVGMDYEELRVLEIEFLVHLRFDLYVAENEFYKIHQKLGLPMYEGKSNLYYSVSKERHQNLYESKRMDTKQTADYHTASKRMKLSHGSEYDDSFRVVTS